jgi:hypothetical protein
MSMPGTRALWRRAKRRFIRINLRNPPNALNSRRMVCGRSSVQSRAYYSTDRLQFGPDRVLAGDTQDRTAVGERTMLTPSKRRPLVLVLFVLFIVVGMDLQVISQGLAHFLGQRDLAIAAT